MKVPQFLIGLMVSAVLGLEIWTLKTLVALDVKVAVLATKVEDLTPIQIAKHQ
jgi:hypothetical protein